MAISRIAVDEALLTKVTEMWDAMMSFGDRRLVAAPCTPTRALKVFLADALAELERLDRDAGGREARRAAIIAQGSIFARSVRADAAPLARGEVSGINSDIERGMHCSSCNHEAAGGESGWAWTGDKVYCDKRPCILAWIEGRGR